MSRLQSKSTIEQLKKEKAQLKVEKKRKVENKETTIRLLIVCEGEKTEPNYFKALIKNNISKVIDYDVKGKGENTLSLVEHAKKELTSYDEVWCVFDKDDFPSFNEAIDKAKKYKLCCAWSNEAFELWYVLHFQYLDTAIGRADYISILNENLKQQYKKNDKNMLQLIVDNGGKQDLAIKYAEKLASNYPKDNKDYSSQKPCTMVYKLVKRIINK